MPPLLRAMIFTNDEIETLAKRLDDYAIDPYHPDEDGALAIESAAALRHLMARVSEVEGRIDALEKERDEAAIYKQAIDECEDNTWQCPVCGHTESWWRESNADYFVRDAIRYLKRPQEAT